MEGLGDLQQLLAAGVQAAHHLGGVDVHPQPVEQLLGLADHLFFVQVAEPAQNLLVQKQVLIDGQVVDDVQLLVDEGNPRLVRRFDCDGIHLLPAELHGASVPLVDAAQDVHQGGLAGAVFAQQCVYLPLLHVEADLVQHGDAKEAFGDIGHL